MQQHSEAKMCKAHKQEKAQYYILNEPWNKFCKSCALNRAICGYKIQKNLSPQEFENKIVLSSLTQELKSMIEICEKESNEYCHNIEKINEQLSCIFSPTIKSIENFINQLCLMKTELIEVYENQINRKVNSLHDTQSKFFMDSISFKNHLDSLQTNYCDIILDSKDRKQQEQFNKITGDIKQEIQKCRNRISAEKKCTIDEYLSNTKTQFNNKIHQFNLKIMDIKNILGFNEPTHKRQLLPKQNRPEHRLCPDQKEYYSHRKQFHESLVNLDLNGQGKPGNLTHRLTNLTLKSMKRNNSIPLRSKNSKVLQM